MENIWQKIRVVSTAWVVMCVSSFVAGLIVFPPGSTLTYTSTHAGMNGSLVEVTGCNHSPGVLAYAGMSVRLAYALFLGSVMGIPAGILLAWAAKSPVNARVGMAAMALGGGIEYSCECLLTTIINVHYTIGAGTSLVSIQLPLTGFAVEGSFPYNLILSIESWVLVRLSNALDEGAFYLLLVIPAACALAGITATNRWVHWQTVRLRRTECQGEHSHGA